MHMSEIITVTRRWAAILWHTPPCDHMCPVSLIVLPKGKSGKIASTGDPSSCTAPGCRAGTISQSTACRVTKSFSSEGLSLTITARKVRTQLLAAVQQLTHMRAEALPGKICCLESGHQHSSRAIGPSLRPHNHTHPATEEFCMLWHAHLTCKKAEREVRGRAHTSKVP